MCHIFVAFCFIFFSSSGFDSLLAILLQSGYLKVWGIIFQEWVLGDTHFKNRASFTTVCSAPCALTREPAERGTWSGGRLLCLEALVPLRRIQICHILILLLGGARCSWSVRPVRECKQQGKHKASSRSPLQQPSLLACTAHLVYR